MEAVAGGNSGQADGATGVMAGAAWLVVRRHGGWGWGGSAGAKAREAAWAR